MQFVVTPKQNNATITYTTRRATWTMRDGHVYAGFWIDLTAAGAVGTEFKVTTTPADGEQFLPQPKDAYAGVACGSFEYLDASANRYVGEVSFDGTDLTFRGAGVAALASRLGSDPSFAVASGDSISGQFTYEAE